MNGEFKKLNKCTVRGWVKLLKGNFELVAEGKSDTDKTGFL